MTNWYKKFSAEADIIDKLADDYIGYGERRLYDLMQDTITKTAVEGEQYKRCLRYKDRVFALVDAAIYRVHGFKLHKEQIAAGLALYEGTIVEQKTGAGKANPATLKIPTPLGWRTVGDIKVGDYLFDRHGKPTKVTGVYPQGKKQIYDVKLVDGRVVPSADEHLWSVYENNVKHFRTYTTAEMYKYGMRMTGSKAYRFRVPVNGAVEYEAQKLPIDPYVLGVFLGNGCKSVNRSLQLSSGNDFVPNEVAYILGVNASKKHKYNYTWLFRRDDGSLLHSYDITDLPWLQDLLSSTRCGDKYIPEMYRIGSIEQRWALLQGLFDTDGCIERHDRFHLTYSTTSEQLRDDVCEVVRSLGLNCSWRLSRKAGVRAAKADQYTININVENDIKQKFFRYPFKLDRAKAAAAKPKRRDYSRVAIDSIVRQEKETDMICFTVDNPEHLFLIGDYVVTHNTVTAIAPAVLRSLEYKGSHIVTVNPYLAKRDADNCTQIVKYLGLTVGCVLPDTSPVDRKRAYKADITYVSNTELGFDYLRDNLVVDNFNKVQRGFHFAIVDEADSILIDEAKTPLIISGQGKDVSLLYMRCMAAVNKLKQGTESREFNKSDDYLGIEREVTGDFIVHEKEKNTILTDDGVKHLEEFLSLKNYADAENRSIQHVVEQCLRARALMKRDKDYIVRDGKIVIVDENTGRTMEGRQYADGLHQAIEAKEGVQISTSNETIGTTTYQNFFRKYKILSGMTGTAATEKREFKSTYGLNVKVIPTHEPVIRVDEKDILFVHESDKYKAIVQRVKEEIAKGRPVLCGTATVEASQDLSRYFKEAGIEHQLLNAKQDEHEAEVVSQAGISGTVTIATNMAGRGTDIKLDEKAREAGGLVVIGCEKHESRRIDNQLRGRSGRQGDPGVSVFYCSCDDRVIRLYGGDALKKKLENTALDTGEPITNKSIYKALELSQKRVEADNFAQRRDTLEYDDVDNIQRERVYAERDKILNKNRCSGDVKEAILKAVQNIMNKLPQDEWVSALESQMGVIIPPYIGAANKSESEYSYRSWVEREIDNVEFVNDNARESYCRKVLLMALDSCWSEQLKALEFARDASGYAGFAQIDPKAAYANEAWRLYGRMQDSIYAGVLFLYFHNRPDKIDVDGISIKAKKGMNV